MGDKFSMPFIIETTAVQITSAFHQYGSLAITTTRPDAELPSAVASHSWGLTFWTILALFPLQWEYG